MKSLPTSPRIRFREMNEEDHDRIAWVISDAVTMQHYPAPYDEQGVERWIAWNKGSYAKRGFGLWALERISDGAFLGDCGITMQNINGRNVPEIGYHLHCSFWRQGYGTEAARACRDWFFANCPEFDAVYSYMTDDNVGSWSVARNNEMHLLETYMDENRLMRVYRITREEYLKLK